MALSIVRRLPQPFLFTRHSVAAYAAAVALPLAIVLATARLGAPIFVFEHLMVLLVVAVAIIGGMGPAIIVALTGSVGDNLLLREPVGRPVVTGARDVFELVLFVAVAAVVGWLVQRLQVAREQAVEAVARERAAQRDRDRLISTVTHDLATPLSAIQGTIQFTRKNTALTSLDLPRLLDRVELAAARATSLVRTLADVRSLGQHELSLQLQPLDLREVAEPVVRMLDRMSDRHPILLAAPPTPLMVNGDAERLGRVLENLIVNAMKYSPSGGTVEVTLGEEAGEAVLSVCDQGIGIPAGASERLFELGFRTEEAAKVAPGMGLGLYTAAEVVRRHGGSIEAEPREPRGTIFTVRLPCMAAAAPSAPEPIG